MFKFTLSIIFTILVTNLYAQIKVTGKITDHTGKPISLAIITLQQQGVKPSGAVSDSSGHYQISNLKTGGHSLRVNFVAYRDTIIKFVLLELLYTLMTKKRCYLVLTKAADPEH